MSTEILFQTHLVLGYVAWLLCFGVYIWPRLKAMDQFKAQRAIATLHSFRFFGLVFILPGVLRLSIIGAALRVSSKPIIESAAPTRSGIGDPR